MLWEKTRVEVPFTLNTKENAISNIEDAIKEGENLSAVFSNAANYYYSSLKDNKTALEYVNKSINLEENYRNLFLKARINYDSDQKDAAIKLAKKALVDAEKNASKGYQNFISGTLEKWSK